MSSNPPAKKRQAGKHSFLPAALGFLFFVLAAGTLFFSGIKTYNLYFIPAILLGLFLIIYTLPALRSRTAFRNCFLNTADLLLALYLLYGICNLLFISGKAMEPLFFIKWAFFLLLYLTARLLPNRYKYIPLYAILFSALLQAIVVLLQQAGILPSLSPDFFVSGTFRNPAHAGAWLSISITILISLLVVHGRRYTRPVKAVFATGAVFMFTALVYCHSRTAFLALGISLCVLFCTTPHFKKRTGRSRFGIILGLCLVSIAAAALLYTIRPRSADSRLLLWKVSSGMFCHHPLFGQGVKSFQPAYMYCQADYFNRYPTSRFSTIANNHYQSFNEFIHLACEQGITGLLLFLFLLGYAFVKGRKTVIKTALASLAVISCFLYTADILPLASLFPLFLGLTQLKKQRRVQYPEKFTALCRIAVLGGFMVYSLIQLRTYSAAAESLQDFIRTQDSGPIKNNVNHYQRIINNRNFALLYAGTLRDFRDKQYAAEVFEEVIRQIPTSEMICDLGALYQELGNYARAEQYYRLAAAMVPGRIMPVYRLFKLYIQTGDREKALNTAQSLLEQPLTVTGSIVLRIKKEVKDWIKTQ